MLFFNFQDLISLMINETEEEELEDELLDRSERDLKRW